MGVTRVSVRYDESFARLLDPIIAATYVRYPLDNPTAILATFTEESHRLVYFAHFAYLRGEFPMIKRIYRKLDGNPAAQLALGGYAEAGGISAGDWEFQREATQMLTDVVKNTDSPRVRTFAELMLSIGPIGAGIVQEAPQWLLNADFESLYPEVRWEAQAQRALIFGWQKDFRSMLHVSQTSLSLLSDWNNPKSSLTEIDLHLRSALAHHQLGDDAAARRSLIAAMDISLPYRFIAPIAEIIVMFGGMTEELVLERYPEILTDIVVASTEAGNNWISYKNKRSRWLAESKLSLRDAEIAYCAARGETNQQIGEKFHLSSGTVKNRLSKIYDQLVITSDTPRKELAELLL